MGIPKIIHYCWLSGDPIPDTMRDYMASWKKYLPDYELMLWDSKRFDINSNAWVKEAFEVKKYAFAADYIRCYALYNYGGIYLDMDVEVLKSFDDLLSLPYFICRQSDISGYEAAVIGFEKHSPILEKVLDYYKGRHFVHNNNYDLRALPKIIEDLLQANYKIRYIENVLDFKSDAGTLSVFSSDWFSPKSYRDGKLNLTKNTYTIHHFTGSWLNAEEKFVNELRWNMRFLPAKLKGYIARFIGLCKFHGIVAAFKASIKRIRDKN